MALGEKLFEETGKVTTINIKSVHPVEGVKMEVSFASEIKGIGKFPSGRNMGAGTMAQYPHGTVDAAYQGVVTTTEGQEQFFWWAHEKGLVAEGGKVKSVTIVTGFTNSSKLSWMNHLVFLIESEIDPSAQEFRGTGYQWK
jgi:hypothetical protein